MITTEKIKEFCIRNNDSINMSPLVQFTIELIEEVLRNRQHRYWISVKERLPDIGIAVISLNNDNDCCVSVCWIEDGVAKWYRRDIEIHNVTHWMSLPEVKK